MLFQNITEHTDNWILLWPAVMTATAAEKVLGTVDPLLIEESSENG